MTVRLNEKLYPLAAVERAAKAFEGVARIRLRRRAGLIEVTFTRVRRGLSDCLADEFANHALAEARP